MKNCCLCGYENNLETLFVSCGLESNWERVPPIQEIGVFNTKDIKEDIVIWEISLCKKCMENLYTHKVKGVLNHLQISAFISTVLIFIFGSILAGIILSYIIPGRPLLPSSSEYIMKSDYVITPVMAICLFLLPFILIFSLVLFFYSIYKYIKEKSRLIYFKKTNNFKEFKDVKYLFRQTGENIIGFLLGTDKGLNKIYDHFILPQSENRFESNWIKKSKKYFIIECGEIKDEAIPKTGEWKEIYNDKATAVLEKRTFSF